MPARSRVDDSPELRYGACRAMGFTYDDLRKMLARGYTITTTGLSSGLRIVGPDGQLLRAPDGRIVQVDPRKSDRATMRRVLKRYGVPLR